MITRRENLLRVLRHQIPEWVPVTGHCDPYNQPNRKGMDSSLAEALGEVQWGDMSTVIFSRYLGLDIMDWFGLPAVRVKRRKVEINETFEDNSTIRVWHTPEGDLREVIRTYRDPATGAVSSNWVEHLVKTSRDIPALAAIFEDEIIEADTNGILRTSERRKFIGDDGLLMGCMEGTPLGMMYRVYSGVATLAYLWADAHDALLDCFKIMEANYLKRLEIGLQSDVDAIVTVDDTSTTAISPSMFEACNIELTNKRADMAHQAGKFYFHHSCGHIRDLLSLYTQTRMDAVDAFTIPPIGNVTVKEGRKLLCEKITIITGGVDVSRSLYDRTAIRKEIYQLSKEAEPYDHFIIRIAGYPNRTIEETKFAVDCYRELLQCR